MSVERAFYFWHKTEGCAGYNSRLQLPMVQSRDPICCCWQLKKPQNTTPKSRALHYHKVDNHILLLHIAVKCLLGYPSVSRLVLPILRLLVTKKETSGKRFITYRVQKHGTGGWCNGANGNCGSRPDFHPYRYKILNHPWSLQIYFKTD